LQAWLATSRLNWVRDVGPALPDEPVERAEALALRHTLMAGIAAKLAALLQSG
jgi:hypothetical protein